MDAGAAYTPPDRPLVVLHADEALLLVDKPSGLLSVPGKGPHLADCLLSRLQARFPEVLLVHRLDRDTSGVMVFARTGSAQRHLGLQFERRIVEKRYVARAWGRVGAPDGMIELPLRTDWPRRPMQMVCHEQGRPARTRWVRMAHDATGSRLALFPETGRSHQLRVHLREIGHPVLGDPFYAPPEALAAASRLMLHAESLRLRHPLGGAWCAFDTPAPF
ncbi:MAG: RluA family pseudouridine synthase [Rhodobacteraceae bacterium]|nr:RluA family pseudouridine synthase [Paracoccaceae bacterium]